MNEFGSTFNNCWLETRDLHPRVGDLIRIILKGVGRHPSIGIFLGYDRGVATWLLSSMGHAPSKLNPWFPSKDLIDVIVLSRIEDNQEGPVRLSGGEEPR